MSQGQQEVDESSEKPHEPSERKLQEARKKGEVPRSTDIGAAAAYAGLLVAAVTGGAWSVGQMGAALSVMIGQADRIAPLFFEGAPAAPLAGLLVALTPPLALWFGMPTLAVLAAVIAQRSFTVAPDKLAPKTSRLSLVSNAKNKFGRNGLFEFLKSFVKLVVISAALALFLAAQLDTILVSVMTAPGPASATMGRLTVQFLALVAVLAGVIGAIDFLWQHAEHRRRHRMSHKELRDEAKEAEGDPWLKQERRARAEAIAANRMLADVPRADVVVVNPLHYAVALRWSRAPGAAPSVVAKGTDEIARRIREIAEDHGVPIYRDPPTARALHADVPLEREIPPEHYRAVAAAIRFAEAMRRRARRGWR
jgi:flagellar biosynthetic protein FlhB